MLQIQKRNWEYDITITGGMVPGGATRTFNTKPEAREYANNLLKTFPKYIELTVEQMIELGCQSEIITRYSLTHTGSATYKTDNGTTIKINASGIVREIK